MIDFGIIGTGSIAATFCKACTLSGCARVTVVYSRSLEKGGAFAAANAPGARATDSMAELLSDPGVQAVYIASPNSLHYSQALACLEAGRHVLCEKPATVTPEELHRLQTEAAARSLVFMEAMMSLHQPQLADLKQAVDQCGRVMGAHISFCQLSSKYPALLSGQLPNIFNPQMATGALMDIGVYCVNAAVALFGEPQEAVAKAVFLDTGADGAGAALLSYADKTVTMDWSKTAQNVTASQILGDRGTVTIDLISMLSGIRLTTPQGTRQICGELDHAQAMANELRDFARYAAAMPRGCPEYESVSAHARAAARLMDRLRRSAGISFG